MVDIDHVARWATFTIEDLREIRGALKQTVYQGRLSAAGEEVLASVVVALRDRGEGR